MGGKSEKKIKDDAICLILNKWGNAMNGNMKIKRLEWRRQYK